LLERVQKTREDQFRDTYNQLPFAEQEGVKGKLIKRRLDYIFTFYSSSAVQKRFADFKRFM